MVADEADKAKITLVAVFYLLVELLGADIAQVPDPLQLLEAKEEIAIELSGVLIIGAEKTAQKVPCPAICPVDSEAIDDELMNEVFELLKELLPLGREADGMWSDELSLGVEFLSRAYTMPLGPGSEVAGGLADDIGDAEVDYTSDEHILFQVTVSSRGVGEGYQFDDPAGNCQLFHLLQSYLSGAHPIFKVVGLLSELVG